MFYLFKLTNLYVLWRWTIICINKWVEHSQQCSGAIPGSVLCSGGRGGAQRTCQEQNQCWLHCKSSVLTLYNLYGPLYVLKVFFFIFNVIQSMCHRPSIWDEEMDI